MKKILIGRGFTTVTKEKKHLVWEDGCFLFYVISRVVIQFFFNRFAGMIIPFIVFVRALSKTGFTRIKIIASYNCYVSINQNFAK
jgi:hypothetical protein